MGGAAPILFQFAVACRPRSWPVRCSGALVRARPPDATPAEAGGGRGGARCADPAASPPGRRSPFGGEGGCPLGPGGAEGWRPGGPQAGGRAGGREGGRAGRAAAPRPPAPWGGPWPPSLSSFVSGAPLRGIHVQSGLPGGRGRQARSGRPPVGQCGGGGGEIASPRSAPPPSPGRPQGGPLRLRLPGCRSSVGRQRVMRECWGDQPGALGAQPRMPRLRCHPPGCSCPPGGVRGRCLSGRPPAVHGLGRGGEWGGSPGPLTPPPDGRGGAAWWFWPWGASRQLEGRTLPLPPSTLWKPEPRASPRSVPLAPRRRRAVLAGLGGGGRAGACWGRRFGSAVSG